MTSVLFEVKWKNIKNNIYKNEIIKRKFTSEVFIPIKVKQIKHAFINYQYNELLVEELSENFLLFVILEWNLAGFFFDMFTFKLGQETSEYMSKERFFFPNSCTTPILGPGAKWWKS